VVAVRVLEHEPHNLFSLCVIAVHNDGIGVAAVCPRGAEVAQGQTVLCGPEKSR